MSALLGEYLSTNTTTDQYSSQVFCPFGTYPSAAVELQYQPSTMHPALAQQNYSCGYYINSEAYLPYVAESSSKPSFMNQSSTVPQTHSQKAMVPKPPYSYISLICMAIADTSEKKATLGQIIHYIETHFEYYRGNKKWHGSIRHNLTINDCFVKLPRKVGNKCCLWTIDPAFKDMFDNGSLRRRRYRFKEASSIWNKTKVNSLSRKLSKTRNNDAISHVPHSSSDHSNFSFKPFENFAEPFASLALNEGFQPENCGLIENPSFTQCTVPQPNTSHSWTGGQFDDILDTVNVNDQHASNQQTQVYSTF